jgi:hypothetical protein
MLKSSRRLILIELSRNQFAPAIIPKCRRDVNGRKTKRCPKLNGNSWPAQPHERIKQTAHLCRHWNKGIVQNSGNVAIIEGTAKATYFGANSWKNHAIRSFRFAVKAFKHFAYYW